MKIDLFGNCSSLLRSGRPTMTTVIKTECMHVWSRPNACTCDVLKASVSYINCVSAKRGSFDEKYSSGEIGRVSAYIGCSGLRNKYCLGYDAGVHIDWKHCCYKGDIPQSIFALTWNDWPALRIEPTHIIDKIDLTWLVDLYFYQQGIFSESYTT